MGVKAGMNLATQNVDATFRPDIRNLAGVHVGIITETKFSKVGIQAEFCYSGEGYVYRGLYNDKLKSKFAFINVPVMLKWYLPVGFNVLGGPQFAMLFDQDEETDDTLFAGWYPGAIKMFDRSTDYKRFAISYALGLGWEHEKGVGFYGRFVQGVTDLSDAETIPKSKHRVIQFGVSYRF